MPWPETGATQYHSQLVLPDKGRAIKGFAVCNSWDLEPWDLLKSLDLGCYQLVCLCIQIQIHDHLVEIFQQMFYLLWLGFGIIKNINFSVLF